MNNTVTFFFFSSRRRHTRFSRDWSLDVCSSDLLRRRVTSYWSKPLHARTEAMMQAAAQVEWIVAATEVDALMLEYNLIKSHRPRFNVRYRDDKSYPYL